MTQAYQKSHHSDFDAAQRLERGPLHRSLVGVDRGTAYVPYSVRPEPRQESRTYALATPIHDLDQDSDQESSRKRASVAVSKTQICAHVFLLTID